MPHIRKTGQSLDGLVGKTYLKKSKKSKTSQSLVGQSFVHDCIETRIPGEFEVFYKNFGILRRILITDYPSKNLAKVKHTPLQYISIFETILVFFRGYNFVISCQTTILLKKVQTVKQTKICFIYRCNMC